MREQCRLESGRKTLDAERRLVNLCVDGDSDAWDHLVEEYGGLIYSIAARYSHDRPQARDLFISILETLWRDRVRRLSAWEGRSRLSTYLCTLASRLCADHVKSRLFRESKRYVPLSEEPRGDISGSPGACAGSRFPETRRLLARAESEALIADVLPSLSEAQISLLKLRYWQGLRYREIAALLGISVRQVGKRLFKIRSTLRAALAERGIKKISDAWE